MTRLTGFILSIVFLLSFLGTCPSLASVEILNLRHWTAPEHTRIVLDLDRELQYTVAKSVSKVQLDLTDSVLAKAVSREYVLDKPGIKNIVFTPLKGNKVRIDLFIAENVETNIFKLKKFQDKPYRLVIDIMLPDMEKKESLSRQQVKVVKKDRIIVIDPGHGGEDPGAIGRRGTLEKDVVLQISKRLKKCLDAGDGTRAFLTREGDYYVTFKKRLSMAREVGADLFISIHADAARNRSASGTSVYCLSTGGASSEAAKILAGKENMADIIGGSLDDNNGSDESEPIILNMFQTNTINQSKGFAGKILSSLCRINDIKFPQVQEAPFRVLKFPEIPAVLIETAYISNSKEELKLRSGRFQQSLAEEIAGTVRDYFALPEQPAPAIMAKEKDRPFTRYKVRKGDTLSRIAREYHTEVTALLALNNMDRRDTLFVGKSLKVPVTEQERQKDSSSNKSSGNSAVREKASLVYKVKRGDTIFKIARKHHAQVSAILKLNNMKLNDPLFAGTELKVPSS